MQFTDIMVEARTKLERTAIRVESNSIITTGNFLQSGDEDPIGICLLYHVGPLLMDFQLSPKRPFLYLIKKDSKRRIDFIKSRLVDMIVWGRETVNDKCLLFEYLHEEWTPKIPHPRKYLLRHFNPTNGLASLNRCTMSVEGFVPTSFVLGPPSPSSPNNCNSHLKAYNLFDLLIHEVDGHLGQGEQLHEIAENRDRDEYCYADSQAIALAESIDFDKVEAVVQEDFENLDHNIDHLENSNNVGLENSVVEKFEVARASNRFIGLFGEPSSELDEDYDPYCDSAQMWDDISKVKTHQYRLVDPKLLAKPHVCYWLRYVFNIEFPQKSTFQCKYEADNYVEYGFDSSKKPALAKKSGSLQPTFKKNYDIINNHYKDPRHVKLMETYVIKKARTISDLYFTLQLKTDTNDNSQYAATNRRFRSVFTMAQQGWSLNTFKELMRLQRANGLPIGHHYLNYEGAYKMLEVMYNDQHEKLIAHLMGDDKPISLIVDSATDISKNHYLIVLFQKLERSAPVVYFYKLIPIGSKESASDLRDAMVREFESEKDGFAIHLKHHLLGFASDGASVMMGQNGLGKKLEKWVGLGRKLFIFHDVGHRYELVFKRALHEDDYSVFFEKQLNDVASFANGRSHKIKHYISETAVANDQTFLNLAHHFEVRWASSHYLVLKKLEKSYPALCNGLKAIMQSSRFTAKQREKAHDLLTGLRDRRFVLHLAFRMDVMWELQLTSKMSQRRGSLIFDKARHRDRLNDAFEDMKSRDGPYLTKAFYDDILIADCNNIVCSSERATSEERYYQADVAYYKGFELGPKVALHYDGEMPPKLFDVRNDTLEDLQSELQTYFKTEEIGKFKIFDPINFPTLKEDANTFGQDEILAISKLFGFNNQDQNEISKEWQSLVLEIVNDLEFPVIKETESNYFWFFYFNDNKVTIKPKIKQVLEMALSIAASSADAERGFSRVTDTKTKKRNRMGHKLLNYLVWFNTNVFYSVEEFPALYYPKLWRQLKYCLVDDPTLPSKRQRLDEVELFEDEYFLENRKVLVGKSSLF